MNKSTIINHIAHAIAKAEGWSCDQNITLADCDNPRANFFAMTARIVLKELSSAGLFVSPKGKEWEDIVHDLNQEIDELKQQLDKVKWDYADAVDKLDRLGKEADEIVSLAKNIIQASGR